MNKGTEVGQKGSGKGPGEGLYMVPAQRSKTDGQDQPGSPILLRPDSPVRETATLAFPGQLNLNSASTGLFLFLLLAMPTACRTF